MHELTEPEEFDDVFRQGVLVVGGHAVNLWARYYAPRGDQELEAFQPFLSKDGDIHLKDKVRAGAVAAAAAWNFRANPEPRSAVLGHIYLVRDGRELTVDVLHTVKGLTPDDLTSTEQIRFSEARSYSVPSPEIMLKAKIANLAGIDQSDRQDARHVKIMTVCCRHYLSDVYAAAVAGQMPERDAVDRYMSTLRVIRTPEARQVDVQHGLNLSTALPLREKLAELPRFPRLTAFYDHQMRIEGPRISM